jgi:hypothetical protein
MANEITLVSDEPIEGEFNEEEQEALAVGEELAEAESQLLAGKYENAEQLEQAYIELQRKLGGGEEEPEQETEEEVEEEEVETPVAQGLITDASSEYAENGQLSAETMAKFSEMSTSDLVQAYIEMQANQQSAPEAPDLTEAEVNSVKNYAGGEESYTRLMQWAGENLPEASVSAFDSVVESGNVQAIQLAVAGVRAEYDRVNGVDGELLTGKAPTQTADTFRSQAEVVRAMSDPRYDDDPAYRQDVFEKLERSNNVQW